MSNSKSQEQTNNISTLSGTMWAKRGDSFYACEEAVKELTSGFYIIQMTDQGLYFTKSIPITDELIEIPNDATSVILRHLETFWDSKEKYEAHNVIWKRGILLHGDPGCGKTSTIHLVSQKVINRNGIVIFASNPKATAAALRTFRTIEKDRPILLIMEEIETIAEHHETELLSLLDGEIQVDNIVVVATTNHIARLGKRIVDRPRRFDVIEKIHAPDEYARRYFIENKFPAMKSEKFEYTDVEAVSENEESQRRVSLALTKLETELASLKSRANSDKLLKITSDDDIKEYEATIKKTKSELDDLRIEREALSDIVPVIDYIVEKTDGLSLAHIVEIILGHNVFEMPYPTVIERMMKMHSSSPSSKSKKSYGLKEK